MRLGQFTSKTGENAGKAQDVVYLSGESGDPEGKQGTEYTLNLNNIVLNGDIKKLGTIAGRTVSITNLGMPAGEKVSTYCEYIKG